MTKHTVAQVEDMIATEDDAEVSAMLRAYADLLAKKQDNGTTHWAGCSESGAKHYKCALLEISRLRDTVTDLRNKLEKKAWFSAYEKKPWVGLTDIEAADCWSTSAVTTWENFEAKLKDKNGE
ncbi:hypothetical protein UFOVP513_39 [uncultured Caudovirales phage]|uniref:Uncharacterized protein n=1 Tax=uncultured Caudovirales phage TaxID=2100421 RepID=A0A6J5MK69_9CAUD|nr:hypothetical protein UFOVP513_39 [uncultured Caudovirales phage]